METDNDLARLEVELLLTGIAERYGYDFRGYSRASMRRRVLRAVELERVHTISALQERVLRDPACMARFIGILSVHVTAMFRDPSFYQCLRERVLPMLRTYPFIRIWHAGCSTGEEVYSLAILLHEEGLFDRTRLYATDIADGLLERAAAGVFPLHAMRDNTWNYQRAGGKEDFSTYYTAGEERVIFRKFLRANMVFSAHNLVSDGPFNEFHLVLCRNVMIYFDTALRERVQGLLYASLARLGTLGLGLKETLNNAALAHRFEIVDSDNRLYRKVR